MSELGITTDIVPTSRHYGNDDLRGQERVVSLCQREGADTYVNAIGGMELYDRADFRAAGIELMFIQTKPVEYPQFGGSFVPSLSIVDVMMFNSVDHIHELLGEFTLL